MSLSVIREPMAFYVSKLERGEPFSLLMYGDGEFLVASRTRTDSTLAFGEVVTPRMEEEMRNSLLGNSPDLFRATDGHLLAPETYGGRDIDSVNAIATRALGVIREVCGDNPPRFYDGVLWDEAVREGNLGPYLKALHKCKTVLVGNERFRYSNFLNPELFVPVPEHNAYAEIDCLEEELANFGAPDVYLLCIGLGAIPLIMRLRNRIKNATFIDVGSVFDVFVGIGSNRGWRAELYRDRARYHEIIRKNLEGL